VTRPKRVAITVVASATTLVVVGAMGAEAQITLPPLLPTTTTTVPGQAPPPTTTTTNLINNLLKAPTTTTATTAPAAVPKAAPSGGTLPGNAGGEGIPPPADAGPFPSDLAAMMNSVRRTRPNNSYSLVDALKPLTDLGMPIEEAMRVGLGRFPVAGKATYSHDWWYPRFGPGWRLHQGTDVFAPRGTPLRSPTTGVVRFGDGGLGGISVYITQSDGTYFYLAHLNNRAEGLKNGQTVNTGDIVGYVGSTGNASGGSPHLHFEVHPAIRIVTVGKGKKATTKAVSAPVRPGVTLPAIDPKPLLDLYLAEALTQLPSVVAAYQANMAAAAPAVDTPAVPVETAAIAGKHLAVGGLIAADAPLVRTPLLLLAFLLMVMVAALMPVLVPRRRLAGGPAPPAEEKGSRRRIGRRGKKASVPTAPLATPASTPAAASAAATGRQRLRTRLRRRSRPTSRPQPTGPAQPPTPEPDPEPGGLRPWQWAAIVAARDAATNGNGGTPAEPSAEPAGEVTDPV
jgi:murein DD-endopeptidase MepM/ murein hydrolase activator NlpD